MQTGRGMRKLPSSSILFQNSEKTQIHINPSLPQKTSRNCHKNFSPMYFQPVRTHLWFFLFYVSYVQQLLDNCFISALQTTSHSVIWRSMFSKKGFKSFITFGIFNLRRLFELACQSSIHLSSFSHFQINICLRFTRKREEKASSFVQKFWINLRKSLNFFQSFHFISLTTKNSNEIKKKLWDRCFSQMTCSYFI